MTKRVIATASAAACLLAVGGAAEAGAAVRSCNAEAGPTVVISSARNMTCGRAKRDMARYRGSISRRFKTPGGFHCTRVSGGRLAGQWRCVKGAKAYRFDFSD